MPEAICSNNKILLFVIIQVRHIIQTINFNDFISYGLLDSVRIIPHIILPSILYLVTHAIESDD